MKTAQHKSSVEKRVTELEQRLNELEKSTKVMAGNLTMLASIEQVPLTMSQQRLFPDMLIVSGSRSVNETEALD
jgi:hypothetical protein